MVRGAFRIVQGQTVVAGILPLFLHAESDKTPVIPFPRSPSTHRVIPCAS